MIALMPLQNAGKFGAVLFQVPPWSAISRPHKDYIAECAGRCEPLQVAVEHQ